MNKNFVENLNSNQRKAVKVAGTVMAPAFLALMALVSRGQQNFDTKAFAGGGPSRIGCDGVYPEWNIDGVPAGNGTDLVKYQFNPTNEDNRVEYLSGGVEKIFDNRNGAVLLDITAKPNQELIVTEVYGQATTDANVYPAANHSEGYRTQLAGVYSDNEKTIARAQLFDNALKGNPTYSGFYFVTGETSKNNFAAAYYTRDQFTKLATDLKAQRDIICAPTPITVPSSTAVPTSTAVPVSSPEATPTVSPVSQSNRVFVPAVRNDKPEATPVPTRPANDLTPVVDRNLPKELGDIEYFGRQNITGSGVKVIDGKRFQILTILSDHVKVNGQDYWGSFETGTQSLTFLLDQDNQLKIETYPDVYTEVVTERASAAGNFDEEGRQAILAGKLEVRNLFANGNCGIANGCEYVKSVVNRVSGNNLTLLSKVLYRNSNR